LCCHVVGAARRSARSTVRDVDERIRLASIEGLVVVAVRESVEAWSRAHSSRTQRSDIVARACDAACSTALCDVQSYTRVSTTRLSTHPNTIHQSNEMHVRAEESTKLSHPVFIVPLQCAYPLLHAGLHTPFTHTAVATLRVEHTVVHPPQCDGSLDTAVSHPLAGFLSPTQSINQSNEPMRAFIDSNRLCCFRSYPSQSRNPEPQAPWHTPPMH